MRPLTAVTLPSLLYRGTNQRGTSVFTWVATTNDVGFSADMSALLQPLWRSGLISPSSYIGVVEFGSEAFHSPENVTFAASDFDIRLLTGTAPTIEVGQLPISCSLAAATHHQGLSRMPILGILAAALNAL